VLPLAVVMADGSAKMADKMEHTDFLLRLWRYINHLLTLKIA